MLLSGTSGQSVSVPASDATIITYSGIRAKIQMRNVAPPTAGLPLTRHSFPCGKQEMPIFADLPPFATVLAGTGAPSRSADRLRKPVLVSFPALLRVCLMRRNDAA